MKKFTLFVSAFVAAFSVSAQPAFQQRAAGNMNNNTVMTINGKGEARQNAMSVRVLAPEEETLTCKYGELVPVIKEDFAKFATGSEEAPDRTTNIKYDGSEYPVWFNIDPKYTGQPNWGADNIFPAGGVAFFDTLAVEEKAEGARINTPTLDCSANGGVLLLRFKARSAVAGKSAKGLLIEAAETNNMGPRWDVLGSASAPEVTDTWQTYEVVFQGGGKSTMFNIVNLIIYKDPYNPALRDACAIFVDDVEVFTIKQNLVIPTLLPHTDYKGTSFRLNWEKVENATSYKVSLFSVVTNDYGQVLETKYVFQNKSTSDNFMDVTGVTSGETYYFTVTAFNETQESVTSHPYPVYELEMPKLKDIDMMDDAKSYKAEWEAVPGAQRYHYMAYSKRIAKEAGEFYIVNENFNDLKDKEGNSTFWTIEDNKNQSYDEHFIPLPEMTMAGWQGLSYAPFQGYVALDAYHWAYNGAQAALISPELDLSKDNGKITVSLKLYGINAPVYSDNDEPTYYQTTAAIALFNFNEEKGDYDQVEMFKPDNVGENWSEHTFTFTKGSERSVIGIFAVDGVDYLFIDDLRITQNYAAGEYLLAPFLMEDYCESTSVDVNIPEHMQNRDIYHTVCAMKRDVNIAPNATGNLAYTTPYAPLVQISRGSYVKVDLNEVSNAMVTVNDNRISVDNVDGEKISLFTIAGQFVASDNSGAANVEFTLNSRGAYIVFVGKTAVKVIY